MFQGPVIMYGVFWSRKACLAWSPPMEAETTFSSASFFRYAANLVPSGPAMPSSAVYAPEASVLKTGAPKEDCTGYRW